MRKYLNENSRLLERICCNKCGRELPLEQGYPKEGCFTAEYVFGYFSHKDGEKHAFDLCEECYDEMIAGFIVPVTRSTETELL